MFRSNRELWNITIGELKHAKDYMLLSSKSAMERIATSLLE